MSEAGRQTARAAFLRHAGWAGTAAVPITGDASFRRYYRLADGGRCAVLMDAPPPVELEKVPAFIAVSHCLRRHGLSAPEIYAEDPANGFLLIEDFGDGSFTRLLAAGRDYRALYALAVDVLIALHRAVGVGGLPDLPAYDETRLLAEAELLTEWYAPSVLGAPLPQAVCDDWRACWREVLPQATLPPTLVLRDYHADNLMLLPEQPGTRACGLLDIQDAVIGSPSYDLVSLLEDARRDLPAALREAMTKRYLAAFPDLDREAFLRSGAILAAQRNSKILGIFTRLAMRDDKPHYLTHIPRVWRLIEDELGREPALAPVAGWLERHLPAHLRLVPTALSAA